MNRLHGTCAPRLIYAGYDSTALHTYEATQTMLYGLKYNVDLGLIRGDATRRDARDATQSDIATLPAMPRHV